MPKLKNLLIALAAAMLSTSVALADTTDDRSYLPPPKLQAQSNDSKATPQAGRRVRVTHYAKVHHNRHNPSFRGFLRAIFH
jgi:hypothetical protein